jgi:hypothetical protein
MDKKTKILIASMGRTGSHLLMEVVKSQFENVKHCHYFEQHLLDWADVVISSKRDFREQMASTKRFLSKLQNGEVYTSIIEEDGSFKGRRQSLEDECKMAMKIYNDWKDYTVDLLPLEIWFTNPSEYIKRVYRTLKVPETNYSDEYINKIIQSLQKPIKENHITKTSELKNYHKTFNDEELKIIYDFFEKNHKNIKDDFLYIEKYL